MDQGSEILAPAATVSPPQALRTPMAGADEVRGRSDDCDDPTDRDPEDEPARDTRARAPGRRRGAQGDLAGPAAAAARACAADAAGGTRALASGARARCAVCRRAGVVGSAWPRRSTGARARHRALHGRATPPRAGPRPAH